MSKRLLATILLLMFSLFPAYADEAKPMSNLYNLITHQQGWLNTSRPLVADDLKGRIILLDFWTYGCINCMQVMPDLAYLEDTFDDNLTIIGVHSAKFKNERDTKLIRQAILRNHLHHPVVNDFDFTTWKAFGVNAWPTFILINPKGLVQQVYTGEGNRDALVHDIKGLEDKYASQINSKKLPIALEESKQPNSTLSFPTKIAYGTIDGAEALVIADTGHDRIVIASPEGKILTTIGSGEAGAKDGDYASAQFRRPQGVLLAYPYLYVADTGNHTLRQVDLAQKHVTTLAGTGEQGHDYNVHNVPALEASLASPWDVAFYPDDKHIVITQAGLHQLWSYDISAKTVSVLAGNGHESIEDGPLPDNALAQTSGLSPLGEKLYFVDAESSSLRVFSGGKVTTLIGSGLFDFGYKEGVKGTALLQHPLGLVADSSGIYVADAYNHAIRRYDFASKTLTTVAGNGKSSGAFNEPNDVIEVGDKLYIADTNNNAIRVLDVASKKVSSLPF